MAYNLEKIYEDAMEVFYNGFTCAETVMYTVKKHTTLDIPDSAIAMSSGFPWGLGGGGCICGALAAATMTIGFITGKKELSDDRDPRCFEETLKLHNSFKEECGATCCRILMKGLERDDPKRKENCAGYVKVALKNIFMILSELDPDCIKND